MRPISSTWPTAFAALSPTCPDTPGCSQDHHTFTYAPPSAWSALPCPSSSEKFQCLEQCLAHSMCSFCVCRMSGRPYSSSGLSSNVSSSSISTCPGLPCISCVLLGQLLCVTFPTWNEGRPLVSVSCCWVTSHTQNQWLKAAMLSWAGAALLSCLSFISGDRGWSRHISVAVADARESQRNWKVSWSLSLELAQYHVTMFCWPNQAK